MAISRIGLGTVAISGGGWQFGWGPQDNEQSVAAITCALEHGLNWIDTASAYGFGRSEEVVARAIAHTDNPSYLFSKASLLDDGHGNVIHSLRRDSIQAKWMAASVAWESKRLPSTAYARSPDG